MAESSTTLHEDRELLTGETLEGRRAIISLMEELEAIDWYSQRIDAAEDPQLVAILTHNRDEEKEHAMMTLEWLRRRDPALDAQMRTYLFTDGDILAAEEGAMADESGVEKVTADRSLGVGSLWGAQ